MAHLPSTLIIRRRELRTDGPPVQRSEVVLRAVVLGNAFVGAERILDHGARRVQIGLNVPSE